MLSDKNYLSNPITRLILKKLLFSIFIFFTELSIRSVSINFLDNLLKLEIINIIFTIFCFAILLNGSNFLDGLNGLLSGYYIFVLISLLCVSSFSNDFNIQNMNLQMLLLKSVIIFFLFNITGKVYLGDSGSYIISMLVGYILIKEYNISVNNLSPYYIVLVLWYPAFENLFSLIRRFYIKSDISSADRMHLHQLLFRYFIQKKLIDKKKLNSFTSLVILILNIPVFMFATFNYSNTKSLVMVIFINIVMYLFLYFCLIKSLYLKKKN